MAVNKTTFIILQACTFLAASAATSAINGSAMTQPESVFARHLTVPIESSHVSIRFDPSAQAPVALLSYDTASATQRDQALTTADILPVVARVTGCRIATDMPSDIRRLPRDGQNSIPLEC